MSASPLAPPGARSRRRAAGTRRAAPRGRGHGRGAAHRTGELVRWAAFCCALTPLVLLLCGSSAGDVFGTALGLAAVTTVCRALLRHSERTAVRLATEQPSPHRGRHSRTGTGAHRGGRG